MRRGLENASPRLNNRHTSSILVGGEGVVYSTIFRVHRAEDEPRHWEVRERTGQPGYALWVLARIEIRWPKNIKPQPRTR